MTNYKEILTIQNTIKTLELCYDGFEMNNLYPTTREIITNQIAALKKLLEEKESEG